LLAAVQKQVRPATAPLNYGSSTRLLAHDYYEAAPLTQPERGSRGVFEDSVWRGRKNLSHHTTGECDLSFYYHPSFELRRRP